MPRAEKVEAVAEYRRLLEDSEAFFVTDYQGLNVADLTELRKKLRENKIRFLVGKNTLFRIAAKEVQVAGIQEHLEGPTAIVFTNGDPAVAARILHDSYKARELPRTRAFWLDHVAYEAEEFERLADLPSRDALLSQLVAAVEGPISGLARMLDGIFRDVIGAIEALADKKRTEG